MKLSIKAPSKLSKDAKNYWRLIMSEYHIDDNAGRLILLTALEAHDRMKAAQRIIEKDGMTTKDRWGQVKAHPLMSAERDARGQFLQGLKQLNLDISPLEDRVGRPAGR